MQLQIRSPHIKIEDRLFDLIQSRIESLSRKYDPKGKWQLTLQLEEKAKLGHCLMHAKIELPQKTLFASSQAGTFELALSELVAELEQQLHHYSGKKSMRL